MNRTQAMALPSQVRLARLRLSNLRRTRVLLVQCTSCQEWVKPRYLRVPAHVCKHCEAQGLNQTWQPSAAHLQRAQQLAARDAAAHRAALGTTGRRDNVTLAGR